MNVREYETIQARLRRKLNGGKPREMTAKRGEGYEAGIRSAMSIIKELYEYEFKEDK